MAPRHSRRLGIARALRVPGIAAFTLVGLGIAMPGQAGFRIGADVRPAIHRMSFGPGIELDEAPGGAFVTSFGGPIHLGSVSGRIKLKSFGQDIRVDQLDGRGSATGFGGDMYVRVVGHPSGGLSIRSYGGHVTVVVPAELGTRVRVVQRFDRAHEDRLRLTSDVPLESTESENWRRAMWVAKEKRWRRSVATTGDGRYELTILTENGDVTLKREPRVAD